jgi:hypothetical protein
MVFIAQLDIKKDPCRLIREGCIRATLRLFSKQTAKNMTVKVNLIGVSIAGRGGFVKADYIIADSPLVL